MHVDLRCSMANGVVATSVELRTMDRFGRILVSFLPRSVGDFLLTSEGVRGHFASAPLPSATFGGSGSPANVPGTPSFGSPR